MDFLKIRKKARERAPVRGSTVGAVPAPGEPAPASGKKGGPAGRGLAAAPDSAAAGQGAPSDAQVLGGADLVAAKLGASLPALPEPPPAAEGFDPRFVTWRPGTGQRPVIAVPEPGATPPGVAAEDPTRLRRAPPSALAAPPTSEAARAVAPESRPPPRAAAMHDPLDEFFFRDDEEAPALASLPADAEPSPEAGPEEPGVEEYLTFRLGVEEYAVAIERVREVLKTQPITEVPRAPAGVLGVVTVRGEVVAVFDPRRRLGLPGGPPPEGSGRIVIVDDGEGPCGLLVDGVASVVRLARGSIEPCPQGIGGAAADCLAGIGRERARLFTVLDLGALLRRAPAPARGGRAGNAGA